MIVEATLFRVFLFIVAALIVFRIAQPYAFGGTSLLDFSLSDKWRANMTEIQAEMSGHRDMPPGHQWTGRTPFVFPFVNMVVWGMGLPLGLAAWAGFLLAFWQIARSLTRPAYLAEARRHLLVVAWVGGMFLWQGLQYVQTMRYLLPIYAFLALLAAWLAWWLVEHSSGAWQLWPVASRAGRWVAGLWRGRDLFRRPEARPETRSGALRIAAYAVLAAVTIGTILWGWGFMAVYRREFTRVTASRWMFANVPSGSHIANEAWDDPLPVSIDGKAPWKPYGPFQGLSSSPTGLINNYDEDTPEKRQQLYQWLDEADYIVLSSARLYGSIPRLPTRYPMTTLYYQLLFQGKLGFQQVLKVTSFPTIFGIQFNDTGAEEAFSVYDHPVVYIFKKTPDYSSAKIHAYFDAVDLKDTVQMWPIQASKAPTALLMTPAEAARQQAGGTWTAIFNEQDLANRVPVLVWLVLLELLGLAAFPLAYLVLGRLSDRGFAFSKTLGVLALAWLTWIGPALKIVPYSRWLIAGWLVVLIAAGALILWRRWSDMVAFWRSHRALLLTEEAIFLALFALCLLARFGNPDLWNPARGGEKPMDFAFLNAVIKSNHLPAL